MPLSGENLVQNIPSFPAYSASPAGYTFDCVYMDALILLEKLRTLLSTAPPLEGRGPYGQKQFAWLGQASALMSTWDRTEAIFFKGAVDGMTGNFNRAANHGVVFTAIHKAIATLENQLPRPSGQVFGPGAAYDFFKALRELVLSADTSVFLVDPYMDAETFDGYLGALAPGRHVRLLFARYADDVRVAAEKFSLQHQCRIETRRSDAIHDRVIFIDGAQCWVLGASVKDAASKKATYLAPLSADIAAQKIQIYEDIWKAATAI